MPRPLQPELYEKVKEEAKARFKAWPSAYASGWLVKEYKRRGGTYEGERSPSKGLDRWFAEKWINVCHWPKKVPCGRHQSNPKLYPYCRPSRKVSPKTPKTVQELTPKEIASRCARKHRNPKRRVT